MLAKRIIPCLDVTAGRVVKGINFINLRDAGDPVELSQRYNEQGADEVVFLDITASSDERQTMVDVVFRTAQRVFIPLTVGGGIREVRDARKILVSGADKVSVNTSAVRRPELITELSAADPHIHGIKLSRNFGQHHAITAGLDHCRGEWVVVMDCDLQDRPEDIPRLWAKSQEGFDVVCARRGHRHDPLWKRCTSWLFHCALEWLSGLHYDPQVANFRIVSRRVVTACGSMREAARGFGIQVHWLGFPTAFVDVREIVARDLRHSAWHEAVRQFIAALAARAHIEGINLEAP